MGWLCSGFQSAPQVVPADYPIETNFADLIQTEYRNPNPRMKDVTLKNLLTKFTWVGTNSSGATLSFSCGVPYIEENGDTFFKQLEISDSNGNSIFPKIPADLEPFETGNRKTISQNGFAEYFRPKLGIIKGELSDWHFTFLIYRDFVVGKVDSNVLPYSADKVKGRFVSTNFLIIKFPEKTFGRVYFSPKPR